MGAKEFGHEVMVRRKKMGKNQADIGALIGGVTAGGVGRWERGESFPLPKIWGKIYEALGIDPSDYIDTLHVKQQQVVASQVNVSKSSTGGGDITGRDKVQAGDCGSLYYLSRVEAEVANTMRSRGIECIVAIAEAIRNIDNH